MEECVISLEIEQDAAFVASYQCRSHLVCCVPTHSCEWKLTCFVTKRTLNRVYSVYCTIAQHIMLFLCMYFNLDNEELRKEFAALANEVGDYIEQKGTILANMSLQGGSLEVCLV